MINIVVLVAYNYVLMWRQHGKKARRQTQQERWTGLMEPISA